MEDSNGWLCHVSLSWMVGVLCHHMGYVINDGSHAPFPQLTLSMDGRADAFMYFFGTGAVRALL